MTCSHPCPGPGTITERRMDIDGTTTLWGITLEKFSNQIPSYTLKKVHLYRSSTGCQVLHFLHGCSSSRLLDMPASLLPLKHIYCVPGKVGDFGDTNCHSEQKASGNLAFKPGHFTQVYTRWQESL